MHGNSRQFQLSILTDDLIFYSYRDLSVSLGVEEHESLLELSDLVLVELDLGTHPENEKNLYSMREIAFQTYTGKAS